MDLLVGLVFCLYCITESHDHTLGAGKALSKRENENLQTGELSSGDGGLMRRRSGCRDVSWGVGGDEWFDIEDDPFERRTKLPSESIM